MNDQKKSPCNIIRNGPKPLLTHLGLLLSAKMKTGDAGDELGASIAFLEGIKKYQLYDYARPQQDYSVIWENGGVKVYFIPASSNVRNSQNDAIFVIPSMVNRCTIMDLLPEQSFCGWLSEQGKDVYLLDWDNAAHSNEIKTIDDIYEHALFPILESIREHSNMNPHIVGYCMGGTLSVGLAALRPEKLKSLSLIATPWDFQSEDMALSQWVKFWAPTGLNTISQLGYLPATWIQTVFASLDPFQMEQKFAAFASDDIDDLTARIFVCVEDWLNDAVDLPGGVAYECIQDWFLYNSPHKGKWQIMGETVSGSSVTCPVCIIASENDRLIPLASSHSFKPKNAAHYIDAECGHIAYMASRNSSQKIWSKLMNFVEGKQE